jgi:tetratricopeptide (TPR) repeat protein
MTDDNNKSRMVLFVALCLILGIVVVYMKVQKYDFVGYDDELYVTQNHYVQEGISPEGIKWAFTTFHSANWHPLTWLSHMLDCDLYGLNPAGHHWTNVEFHIANTLLLFIILFKMTGALWQSAFVAALFALHPLHVESVAWISERKDVLSTFFGLLSIAAYCHYVKKSSVKYYLLVIIFLSLGLMAKPMVVTLPFVLLLLDYWPLKRFQFQRDFHFKSEKPIEDVLRRNYRIILEKIPLFIPVVISCIMTFIAQKSEGAVKPIGALPLKYRIANTIVSYTSYVLKAIWPQKLAVFYPHPGNTLRWWQIAGSALLIISACYGAIRWAKKYPYILVGLFWYLGTLVPVIGLVQVGNQAMADRYTYIPLIGIFIIVSWGVSDLFKERFSVQKSEFSSQLSDDSSDISKLFNKQRFHNIFLTISALILLAALSWRSFFQLNTWENGITLFEHAVSVTENNYQAHNNLGKGYESIDLDKALFHFKAALKINPNNATSLYNLGNVYLEKGDIDEAVRHYLKALSIKPEYPAALNNLGEAFVKKGDYDNAIYYFKTAFKTDPQNTNACMNIANVLFLQSKPDEAISQYREILQTDTKNPDVYYNLAYVLSTKGNLEEAVSLYKEVLNIAPEYSKAHYNLGNIRLKQGDLKEAFTHFTKAIKINPNYVQAYNKIGLILFKQGKYKKAGMFFSKALQLDPEFSEARTNLDIIQNTILSRSKKDGAIY